MVNKLQSGGYVDRDEPDADDLGEADDKLPEVVEARVLQEDALKPMFFPTRVFIVQSLDLFLLLFI